LNVRSGISFWRLPLDASTSESEFGERKTPIATLLRGAPVGASRGAMTNRLRCVLETILLRRFLHPCRTCREERRAAVKDLSPLSHDAYRRARMQRNAAPGYSTHQGLQNLCQIARLFAPARESTTHAPSLFSPVDLSGPSPEALGVIVGYPGAFLEV